PDLFVAGELVEKGQEERRPVQRARIVAHDDVVPVEGLRRRERATRADGLLAEATEHLLLLDESLLLLGEIAVLVSEIGQVALEVFGALAPGRGRVDRRTGGRDLRHQTWPSHDRSATSRQRARICSNSRGDNPPAWRSAAFSCHRSGRVVPTMAV